MKKTRSIVCLIITVVLTAILGFLEINGMTLWTPWKLVPMVNEIQLGLDLRGGLRVIYEAQLDDVPSEDRDLSLQGAMDVLRTRLDSAGYTEATINKQGNNQIVVEIPGVENAEDIADVLGTPAVLTFRGEDWKEGDDYLLTGDDVASARAASTTKDGWCVVLNLTSEGTTKFREATSKYLNKEIGIYLDEDVISSPKVNSVISEGEALITGNFTAESAQNLANLIQSGALPIPLEQIALKTVGATLGSGSLEKTLLAGAIAFAIILLFMAIVYRLPGLMADLALLIYMVLMIFALYTFKVTLTLSGIAGIILSVGMAVDANVVIFERIKEELRAGRSIKNAVEKGFKNAFTAVLDANVTTLIAVIVLAIFGTGTVQGFAVTLGIGIVLSLITEVFFVHIFLKWMVGLGATKPGSYGVKDKEVAVHA